jgi:exoribonuclease-2
MESGSIVEYIDRQRIMCAVVLEVKNRRLRLLTESNREINLSANRLAHMCKTRLDLSMGRMKMVHMLKEIAGQRNALVNHIDIKELWEVLNTEQEWIDLDTMTEFCFPDNPNDNHESAVIRAFFHNRLYFKFHHDRFFPNTQEQVEQRIAHEKEIARKNRIIQEGGDWLANVLIHEDPRIPESNIEIVNLIKSFYLFGKESRYFDLAKAILERAGIDPDEEVFNVLVKLNVFEKDENVDLHRFGISAGFSDEVNQYAAVLIASDPVSLYARGRKDLTMLPLMTIDGQSTLDFDDAISIEDTGDHYRLGIHIVDVGHFVQKGDCIDREALSRGSSIYMPDSKIPMLPSGLAEDLCSLKAGTLRPAISLLVTIDRFYDVTQYEIVPSLINVSKQLTYFDVNIIADENEEITTLRNIAERFRQDRMTAGAVQITLPDINVWIADDGEIAVNKINRESPGRMLVSEIMIMANCLKARFLGEHHVPAIFRAQASPRERLYKGNKGTLFQNWMQRKLLSRFVLTPEPEHHSGLGLNAYVTATSPIRKYFDLATQRQIRAVFGLEAPYTVEDIENIIQMLEEPMSYVAKIQYNRHRYWLLKYLEKHIGQKEEAIVLYKKRNNYQILLTEYLIECELPLSSGISLKAEDLIQVTIQHANARKDVISVFMG